MNIHFIVHEAFEGPGALQDWAEARGWQISHSRVYAGQALPASVADIDLLVLMGGPQSPSTTRQECPHFDAEAECALIRAAMRAGKAVLGVCLGAQLMGHAVGAAHEPSPEKEIGHFPIQLNAAGLAHPLLADFGRGLGVGHWHGDMPGLSADARVLAFSEGCPRQIIEYGPLAFGLQCHLEFRPADIERLIEASGPELEGLAGHRFVQPAAALRAMPCADMNARLFGFLDRLSQAYAGRRPA